MKIFQYEYTQCIKPAYFSIDQLIEQVLFFDIETTGFSPKNTILYLIGALWFENDKMCIRQWFNEDGCSEAALLSAFDTFCKEYSVLVHFNGLGFDLPYLKHKTEQHQLSYSPDTTLQQFDILKEIRPYKRFLGLDSLRLKAIEEYLGIKREDTYTGKELIHIYQRYVAKPDDALERLLVLHNHDDLIGMVEISTILHYKALLEDAPITSINQTVQKETLI